MLDLDYCSADDLVMRRNSLRRELLAGENLRELRIAVLGGSTMDHVVNTLELLLLANGFRPTFHKGEYGRFYEEAVHEAQELAAFKPDLIYLHTSCRNVVHAPPVSCTEADLPSYVEAELGRYREIWDSLEQNVGCQVIQNNFELAPNAILGNMDAVAAGGRRRFLMMLNLGFAEEANRRPKLMLQDVHGISAEVGLRNWFDWDRYFSYKILLSTEANLAVARSLNAMIRAIYGKSRKVLVLDLDNTVWGGIIGDDGVDKIHIGRETPQAEAYTAFQEYCLSLRERGVLLAVCSKNNEDVAKSGFTHPDSVLKLEHISCFKANWDPKHGNILEIAKELNLGVDSFVFADDNPAEREIVRSQIPGIAVPEIGNEVTKYAEIIQAGRYFEPASLSKEDLERAALYAQRSGAIAQQAKFANYGEYLDSLEMTAEIDTFKPVYLERIAQLTNKSNQFNLTTRRYTVSEMEGAAGDADVIALYGKLSDKFGDNGLVSVVMGHREGDALHMDLWLMSCRVLKRDMENAMLDAVVERAKARGMRTIYGYFIPSAKNAMVKEFYPTLGFAPAELTDTSLAEGSTAWKLDLSTYTQQNTHIRVLEFAHA
jgi:FkbH-like protein